MNWFKQKIKSIFKVASGENLRNTAIQQLSTGSPPSVVINNFINEMSKIDPSFSDSADAFQLRANQMDSNSAIESLRAMQIAPDNMQTVPNFDTQQDNLDIPNFDAPQPDNAEIPKFEEFEVGQGDGTTEEDLKDIIENEAEKTDKEPDEIEEELFLDVLPEVAQDPNKPIMVDPTIRKEIEVPLENLNTLFARIQELNKKLVNTKNEPWQVEVIQKDYPKTVESKGKIYTNVPHAKVKLTGSIPVISDQTSFRIHEDVPTRKGEPRKRLVGEEEKGIAIVGYVEHRAIPKEREEQILQNQDPKLNELKKHIIRCREKEEIPYYNEVQGVDDGPDINGRFAYTPPTECCACGAKHRRVRSYICVVVEPDKLVPVTKIVEKPEGGKEVVPVTRQVNRDGKWVEEPVKRVPKELISHGRQEQIGGACAGKIEGLDVEQRIRTLEKNLEVPKSMAQGKGETDAQKKKREEIQAKDKEPWKTLGWNKIRLPSENILASVINLMRNPNTKFQINDALNLLSSTDKETRAKGNSLMHGLRGTVRSNAFYYTDSKKDPTTLHSFRARQAARKSPNIIEEDLDLAEKIRVWWASKFAGIEADINTRNMSNLAIHSEVSLDPISIKYMMSMVNSYLSDNRVDLKPAPPKEFARPRYDNPFIRQNPFGNDPPQNALPQREAPQDIAPQNIAPQEEAVQEPGQEDLVEPKAPRSNYAVENGQTFITPAKLEKVQSYWKFKRLKYLYRFVDPSTGNTFVLYSPRKLDTINEGDTTFLKGKSFGKGVYQGEVSTSVSMEGLQFVPENQVNEVRKTPGIVDLTNKKENTENIIDTQFEEPKKELPPVLPETKETPISETPIPETPIPETPVPSEQIKSPETKKPFETLVPRAMDAILKGIDVQGQKVSPSEVFNKFITFLGKYNPAMQPDTVKGVYTRALDFVNKKDTTPDKSMVKSELEKLYRTVILKETE